MSDVLYADVSEFQIGVDDSYPYSVIAIRACDGTYRDHQWDNNYNWCKANADSGRLDFFIVYCVYRQNWVDVLNTLQSQCGTPHPKMVVMLDVESWGGQIGGDNSDSVNRLYWGVADWLGTSGSVGTRRVIGYANSYDLYSLWPTRPDGVRIVGAGYGQNPNLPGQIAHQYTDGQGYGGGLPEGASPFGVCDMNCADGLDGPSFAAACGVDGIVIPPVPTPVLVGDEMDSSQWLAIRGQFVA